MPAVLSTQAVLQKLRDDNSWLPPSNAELVYLVEKRIRALRDNDGSNRWLHHRWLMIFEEMCQDMEASFNCPEDFNYVCLGAGTRNPLSFPLLVFLAGAGRAYIVEPEKWDNLDDWRVLWGLQEMVLRLLSGNVSSRYFKSNMLERMNDFLDPESLFFKQNSENVLNKNSVCIINSYFENAGIPEGSIDLLSSRSVLEHVMDYDKCFDEFAKVMRPGGLMYHDIGLAAHSNKDLFEFYYKGRRKLHEKITDGLNELRLSDYLSHFEKRGFECKIIRKTIESNYSLDRGKIQERFKKYNDEDLLCSRVVVIARK